MSPERSEEEAQREERFGSERESIYFVEFFLFVSGSILFLPLTMNAPFFGLCKRKLK